jgi:UDP-N-acetyl-D-mannosaminuronate dehydrogenase
MRIAVAGMGYVGLSNACLLAPHNDVIAVDVDVARVGAMNARHSPIDDPEIEHFFATAPRRFEERAWCRRSDGRKTDASRTERRTRSCGRHQQLGGTDRGRGL